MNNACNAFSSRTESQVIISPGTGLCAIHRDGNRYICTKVPACVGYSLLDCSTTDDPACDKEMRQMMMMVAQKTRLAIHAMSQPVININQTLIFPVVASRLPDPIIAGI